MTVQDVSYALRPEVEPLNIGQNIALRYNALNLNPNFFCYFDPVITRRTGRGDE